jgi:hypothetical protein
MRFRSLPILVLLFAFTLASWAQTSSGQFTVVTLPDTQNYSEYYPQILTSQTQWIANNAAALNIQFVLGLGDIVNDGSATAQYANADASYRILDNARIPYLAALGNHDYANATPLTRDATVFNSYFGPARYAGKSYYGSSNFPAGSNENFYGVFNVNGTSYLVLVLEFIPRNSAIAWASNIIEQNPDKSIIIVTHAFLTPSGFRQGHCDSNSAEDFGLAGDNDAGALWDKLVSKYPNVMMVLNGHDTGYAYRQDLGNNGNLVNQIVSDYQDWADGGGGYLRIMTFNPALNQISVTSYSPYYNTYLTDAGNQFTINMTKPITTSTTGSVAGIVRNQSSCAPIGGVTVSAPGGEGTSNSGGYYGTGSVTPAFPQTVTASASGWATNTETVKVDAGYNAQINYFMVPSGSATGSITINAPAPGTNVVSPVPIQATGTSSAGAITTMEVYDTGTLVYSTSGSSINTSIPLALGGHELFIQGSDTHGNWFKNVVNVVVQKSGSVTMTSPLNNQTVVSPVTFTGQAASAPGIAAIQIYEDGKLVYTTTASSVNTSIAMTAGAHSVVMQAFDTLGNVFKTSAAITVTAPVTPPTSGSVTMTSPLNNQSVVSPVTFTGQAASAPGITAMQVYEDNKLVYNTAASSVNTSIAMTAGAHNVVMQAFDAAGNVFKTSAAITVTAPSASTETVTVASPAQNASVASPVSIVATAAAPTAITAMQIYEDNKLVYQTASASLSTSLAMSTGAHTLAIKAWDAAGASSLVSRTITVK